MERFLFRLSESSYQDRFILKGALLLKVWEIAEARATVDIDTLAKTSNSLENILSIIKTLCELTPSIDDGVVFPTDAIHGHVMQLQKEYQGVRIRFKAKIGTAQIPMQIDIGFGDIITPFPDDILYPTLLDLPSPKLKAYPSQTVIAEKIQTMFEKGNTNSRIKDYYDVWLLLRHPNASFPHLQLALSQTFQMRNTPFDRNLIYTTIEQYAQLPRTQLLWNQFKQKELPGIHQELSFQTLTEELLTLLLKELANQTNHPQEPADNPLQKILPLMDINTL